MTHKRKLSYIVGLSLVGVLLCLGLFLVWVSLPSRPDVPLAELVVVNPDFPTTWNSDRVSADVVWQENQTLVDEKPASVFRASASMTRVWAAQPGPDAIPQIFQRVLRYDSSIEATWYFYGSRPEQAYANDWPNFAPEANEHDRYPTDWNYQSRHAHQEHVACAMGAPDNCQLWYYWARYGQYLLQVQFFAPNLGADTLTFAQVVAEVDSYVGQQLEN